MASKAMECMNLSEDQIKLLEESFKDSKYPGGTTLVLIAAQCGLSEEETQQWFKLRNEQWRKAEGLPPQQGSVLD
ncbi:homeodomain-only protein [Symphorus nematophorus]